MRRTLTKAFELHNSNFHFLSLIAENTRRVPISLLPTLLAVVRFMPNAFPKIETLSNMTGHSTRTVMRKIKRLEELGFLKVTREHRKSNRYELILSSIVDSVDENSLGDTYLSHKNHSRVTTGEVRVTNSALLGDTYLSHQHINKHINKEHIKENFEILSEKEKQERLEMVEDYKKKKSESASKGKKS